MSKEKKQGEAEQYSHICIKPACSTRYTTTDPDAYYCPSCKKQNVEVAKKIDAQIATKPRKTRPLSNLQQYYAELKAKGVVRG